MKRIRSQKGVSGLVIVLGVSFMILFPLGLLGYEFMRYTLVQQELRSVTDAAALAGAVGIATNGGGGQTIWGQDKEAMSGAYNQFCTNSVTDCRFEPIGNSNANVNSSEGDARLQPGHFNRTAAWTNVAPHTAEVNFVLLDPSGNVTNWDPNAGPDQAGLVSASNLRVDAYYGYSVPILGGASIGPFTMTASSTGGLPQLDVVLCFDVSGSMDDFTNVTFVNRYWVQYPGGTGGTDAVMSATDLTALVTASGGAIDPATFVGGCVMYEIPRAAVPAYPASPYWTQGADGSASGPLYYVQGCNTNTASVNGTTVNVQPPMNLNQAILVPNKFFFDPKQRASGVGKPPGNYPTDPATKQAFAAPSYTDLIVNPNGDAHFTTTGVAQNGVTFETFGWTVEAARGNLEDAISLQQAVNPDAATPNKDNKNCYLLKLANGTVVGRKFTGPTTGAQQAYWSYVRANTHPLRDAVEAAQAFFTFLYGSTDCHMGLICFSDGIGKAPDDTWADGWTSPPGSTHLNGWTTKYVNDSSSSPAGPCSAQISGVYTGGAAMGAPTQTDPTKISGPDPNGGDGRFPLPLLPLNKGVAYNTASSFDNYSTGYPVNNYMNFSSTDPAAYVYPDKDHGTRGLAAGGAGSGYPLVALGSTDITDALAEAVRQLTPGNGFSRPRATRAIVLFTDGCPTIDQNSPPPTTDFTTLDTDCQAEAAKAYAINPHIPIFSIGLALDPSMKARQSQLLNDITLAANGGNATGLSQAKQIDNVAQIRNTFQSIAKNLVVITK